MPGPSGYSYTVINFTVSDLDISSEQVLRLLQRLSLEFSALNVERPGDEMALLGLDYRPANSRGTDPKRLAFEEAVARLEQAREPNIYILMQPAHPLDRQSPGYQRLSRAAGKGQSPVIYFPETAEIHGDFILLAGHEISSQGWEFASSISGQMSLPLEAIENIINIDDLQHALLMDRSRMRPTILIWDQSVNDVADSLLMKLAAVTRIPVLVYR